MSTSSDTDSDTTDTEVSGSNSNGDGSEHETDVTEDDASDDASDDSDEDDDEGTPAEGGDLCEGTDGGDLWERLLHISQDLNVVLRRSLKRKRIDLKQKEMLLKQMRYPTIDEDDDNDTDDVS